MAWALLGPASQQLAPLLLAGGGCSSGWPLASQGLGADATCAGLAATALRHIPLMLLVVLHLSTSVGAEGVEGPAPGPDSGNASSERAPPPAAEVEPCSKALGFNESNTAMDRSYQDLMNCEEHHKRTCCEKNHTAKIHNPIAFFVQERSPRCAKMGQLALCSVCDGDVGIGSKSSGNLVALCPSFCENWFKACVDDFFAHSSTGLQPCGHGTLVCSPLGEIVQDAAEFCTKIGAPLGASFTVGSATEEALDQCFDGIPAAHSRGAAVKAAWSPRVRRYEGNPQFPEWWRRWGLPEVDVYTLNRWNQKIEQNAPGIIIACVAIFFAWYVWAGMD